MNILVPQGIGDALWALTKVQSMTEEVHLRVGCFNPDCPAEARSLEFLQRFNFVESVAMHQLPERSRGAFLKPGDCTDKHGHFRYIDDGPPDFDCGDIDYILMPNTHLEMGLRLEDWLTEYDTDWDIMGEFGFTAQETDDGERVAEEGQFVAFFMGSVSGNTIAGHNRGGIWTHEDWRLLHALYHEHGHRVVVVGTENDAPYCQLQCERFWDLSAPQLFAMLQHADAVVSYQSGVGMVPVFMGTPAAIWWREKGDSISPDFYASFEESMATAWVPPHMQERYLPLIYGRETPDQIFNSMREKGWI